MIYSKDAQIIVLRFTMFRKYDFVKEHNKVFQKCGNVWMLKSGRNIPSKSLQAVVDDGGYLILKAPKKAGGKYYCATIMDFSQGAPLDEYNFPSYYLEFSDEYNRNPLEGTWLKISRINEMNQQDIEQLVLCSNKKTLIDVVGSTRTSVMYVEVQSK